MTSIYGFYTTFPFISNNFFFIITQTDLFLRFTEILTVELFLGNCKYFLMLVYHPPSSSPTRNLEFVNLLTSHLKCVLDFNSPVIVAGDINLNLLNPKNLNYIDIYINK